MSYGFEAKNSNGEVVISSEYPVYVLGSATTISGTARGTTPETYTFSVQPADRLRFWQMSVGDGISLSRFGPVYVGTKATFTIRETLRASLAAAPTGYGVVVYDASGNQTYISSSDMVSIGDRYTVTPDYFGPTTGTTVTTSDTWVAIEKWGNGIRPLNPFPGNGVIVSSGVYRATSTSYSPYGTFIASAPPDVYIPIPCTFITGK